jgi:hypothetical protein
MSFELPEFDPEELSGFTEELNGLKPEELDAFNEKYQDTLGKFKAKMSGTDPIRFNSDGDMINFRGNKIDPVKLKESLGDSQTNGFESNPEEFYNQMGFEGLDTPEAKEFFKTAKEGLDSSKSPSIKAARETFRANKELNERLNNSEQQRMLDRNQSNEVVRKLQDQIDELNKAKDKGDFEKYKETIKGLGKFLKVAAYIGFGAWAITSVVDLVKEHQNAMNGCWLMKLNATPGDSEDAAKRKIRPLTCDPDNRKASDMQYANYITDWTKTKDLDGNLFNPMLNIDISFQTPPPKQGEIPGEYYEDSCPSSSQCCKNYSNCVVPCRVLQDADDSGICRDCKSSKFNVKQGWTLFCGKFTFADAFYDLTGKTLDQIEGLLDKIINVLKTVGIIILCIFGIFILVKIIMYIISNVGKKSDDKDSNNKSSESKKE